jgi:hypothetical protein
LVVEFLQMRLQVVLDLCLLLQRAGQGLVHVYLVHYARLENNAEFLETLVQLVFELLCHFLLQVENLG